MLTLASNGLMLHESIKGLLNAKHNLHEHEEKPLNKLETRLTSSGLATYSIAMAFVILANLFERGKKHQRIT